jgi:lia operon protein LiaG
MSEKKGKRLGRFALWVFVIMIVSFSISGSIIAANKDLIFEKITDAGITLKDGAIKGSGNIDDEKSISADGVGSIYVDEVSADINIIRTDDAEITVHFYGTVYKIRGADVPELEVVLEDGDIGITVKRPKSSFFNLLILSEDTKLDIYLPEDYTGRLIVDAVSSDISAAGLMLNELKLETVSGNIDVKDPECGRIDLTSVSGNITVAGKLGESSFDTVSGNVELMADGFEGDTSIYTISGRIHVTITDRTEGFKLKFSSVSGEFGNSFDGLEAETYGDNGFTGTYGNGMYEINAESVSGSMQLD